MTNGEWGLLVGLGFGISTGFWTVERKLNQLLVLLSEQTDGAKSKASGHSHYLSEAS